MSQPTQPNHTRSAAKLFVVVIAMFGFGFALVPLYDVFCDITGINGKTSNTAAVYEAVEIDHDRWVTVEFITRTHSAMPWEFKAVTNRIRVRPGEMNEVDFYARNPAKRSIVGQAVPSVSPGTAALYLNKTECFCFEQQPLGAGEETTMPMRFYVDPQLPEKIEVFTVSYTLYDVSESAVAMN